MRTRIYLAKSNRANPDHVLQVRSLLAKYPNDIEIVEFKGGAYSHKDLKTCDILLVIPDLSKFDAESENYIDIGKGLHEQIMVFKNQSDNKCDTLVVIESENEYTMITEIDDIDTADPDDYINYSSMIIGEEASDLESMILNRFVSGDPEATQPKTNEYMYLLIGE